VCVCVCVLHGSSEPHIRKRRVTNTQSEYSHISPGERGEGKVMEERLKNKNI